MDTYRPKRPVSMDAATAGSCFDRAASIKPSQTRLKTVAASSDQQASRAVISPSTASMTASAQAAVAAPAPSPLAQAASIASSTPRPSQCPQAATPGTRSSQNRRKAR
jgi:hypothetical protein